MRARSFAEDKAFSSEWLMSAVECLPLPKPRGEHKARLAGAPVTDRQKQPRLGEHLIGALSLVRGRHGVEIMRSVCTYHIKVVIPIHNIGIL